KKLWRQGLFADVKIYATRIINDVIFLNIDLKERVRLSKYRFKGVKKADEENLKESVGLIRGRIINQNLLNNAKNSILKYYTEKGYLDVAVEVTQERDSLFANRDMLTLKVERGDKVKINEIYVKGNKNLSDRKIKKRMSGTKERNRIKTGFFKKIFKDIQQESIGGALGNISLSETSDYIDANIFRFKPFSSSKFIEDDFEDDKRAIIDYYNSKGYRDARVISDTIYSSDPKNVVVELQIEEGERYYFRDIAWRGNSKYTDKQLATILGIEKGDTYNLELLNKRLQLDPNGQDIGSLYMDDGYLFFQITPVEKAVEEDSIDLVINVYEGAQATVDRIIIKGNTKTNEHVIRRELRSVPGAKFSRSDLIRSQREIANLGYFDPEQIGITPLPNPQKGTVDIEYSVVEKSTDQLELSAGWSGNSVVGSLGVSFNNFSLKNIFDKSSWHPLPSGDGQRLSLRYQSTGRRFRSVNFSFTEPWLGGKRPNALTVSVFNSRYRQLDTQGSAFGGGFNGGFNDDGNVIGSLDISGASVGLGRRLTWPDDNFSLQLALNYQRFQLNNWQSFPQFIIQNGFMNNVNLTASLGRYSIDNPIFPRTGSNISLTLQVTPPYSEFNDKDYSTVSIDERYKWAEYHKWKFKAEWYTPVVGKFVLKTAVKMGLMGFFNEDIGYSPLERFEVGGDGIANFDLLFGKEIIALRGYEVEDVMGTRNTAITPIEEQAGDPFYAKYTMELRYPLSLNPSSTIYALTFLEGGNAWRNIKTFNPLEIRRSAGVGLRIFLPMFGTLGFDYGVGFDKQPNTSASGDSFLSRYGKFSVILGVDPE
ncbi:MAG: BamA/OMP85 family outer membrane protein, partial [Chitinophagales bacterium]